MITRAQIIRILEGELNAIENRETEDNAQIHHVLQVLIDGLEALEGGETPPLFVAKKVKARGKWPANVRRLKLIAVGAVKALRKVGSSAQEAIEIVAKAWTLRRYAIGEKRWGRTQARKHNC
jgi:hypothetical protein